MPSNSGDYEDIIGWTDFATIWNDLEPDFENEAPDAREEDGEKNTLVRFLKEKTAKSWAPLAQEIAKLRGVLFSELFPFCAAADATEGAVQKRGGQLKTLKFQTIVIFATMTRTMTERTVWLRTSTTFSSIESTLRAVAMSASSGFRQKRTQRMVGVHSSPSLQHWLLPTFARACTWTCLAVA